MVLARVGSERRAERRRKREKSLGLGPDERLGDGLRRMAIAQAELAIETIESCTPASMGHAVHEARKAIKRLRTIVRLLEGELGSGACEREQATLRSAAAALAGARDAEVMLATLEGLIAQNPRRLAGRRGLRRLREHLTARREEAELLACRPAVRISAAGELRAFAARAHAWQLAEGPGLGPVEEGLRRIYREGRSRRLRAVRGKGGRMRAMHQWRKRVKDLRYAAEVLERRELRGRGSRAHRARAAAEEKWLHRLAGRADELGELLGEEHDLAVLGAWLRTDGGHAVVRRGTRRQLEKLISKRRSELRRKALRDGKALYRRSPRDFVDRVRRACARTAPKLS